MTEAARINRLTPKSPDCVWYLPLDCLPPSEAFPRALSIAEPIAKPIIAPIGEPPVKAHANPPPIHFANFAISNFFSKVSIYSKQYF